MWLTDEQHRAAKKGTAALVEELHLVEVSDDLITAAADLGGALLVGSSILTSADQALCEAASHCGLHVANPLVPAP